jgi:hypothetical protein
MPFSGAYLDPRFHSNGGTLVGLGSGMVVSAVEQERCLMTGERWQEIRTVLEAAMPMDSEKRRTYLDEACASDPSLRGEVESLLAADQQAQAGFLESPPLARKLEKGTRLGDYEIQSLLGGWGHGRSLSCPRSAARTGCCDQGTAIVCCSPQ